MEKNAAIAQPAAKQRYYKIIIANRNNVPFDVRSVSLSWDQQNLYFIAPKGAEPVQLCTGNSRLKKPEYDLAAYVNNNNLSTHPYERMKLANVRSGDAIPTLGERLAGMEKTLLTIVIVILVIGMGWMAVFASSPSAG